MDSRRIVRSLCEVYKNHVFANRDHASLDYDNDLHLFKLIINGQIWIKFLGLQVDRMGTQTKGSLRNRFWFYLVVKYPQGDEYSFHFLIARHEFADELKKTMYGIIHGERARAESIRLLKSREKVSISQLITIFKKYGIPFSAADAQKFIEESISSGTVTGVFKDTEFVSKFALEREQVRYDIITKFEISCSGAVVLKCPNCAASISVQSSDRNGKCSYCGSTFVIPKKILDLL
jgi:DNA-directed RNA polymerase subunit RPC12/RpoP